MIKQKEITVINEATVAWRKMTFLLKDLQSKVISVKKIDDLIQTLLEADLQLDDTEELSIIYRHEGADEVVFLAKKGQVAKKDLPNLCFTADNQCIANIIRQIDNKSAYLSTADACEKAGFADYKSVFIVPMQLNARKNVGAFILHHPHRENAYGNDIQAVWKVLSDQVAFFIRTQIRIQYHQIFDNVRRDLLAHHFEQECDLISAVVDYVKRWYHDDDIYVLIKNTLNLDTYYLACDKGEVKQNFRDTGVMKDVQVNTIVGGHHIIEQLETQHEMVISSPKLVMKGIEPTCLSWLGASFSPAVGHNLGFIILHNKKTKNAYAMGEDAFLDRIADFTALLLADYRLRKKYDFIKTIQAFNIENKNDEQVLYQKIYQFLHRAYGVNALAIAKIDPVTHLVEPAFNKGEEAIRFDNTLQNIAIQHAETLRNETRTDAKKLTIWHKKQQQCYLIAPMRTGNDDNKLKVIGCFIIPVVNAGNISARTINSLSDALATKLNEIDQEQRIQILHEFAKHISQISTVNLTQKKVFNIVPGYIEKVMFTDNLYIALYDDKEGSTSFPIMLKDGKEWPEATRPKPRPLDPDKQGRTEAIILSEKPILHLTHAESKAWYKDPQHPERAEFVGDYLASWVGVPVFYNNRVGGVIATYHPTVDYVYSQADVWFLQNIAQQVSRLLLTLELSTTQATIAEQQHMLSTSLLAHDLTHRLNNSIAAMVINIQQAHRDIQAAIKFDATKNLEFTLDGLEDTENMLQDLVKEIKDISNDATQCIHLNVLLDKIATQVRIGKRLNDIRVNITLDIDQQVSEVSAHYRTLFNSLYAVIDNAADALVTQYQEDSTGDALYLSISAKQLNDIITIQIEDNGALAPTAIKNALFEHGTSSKNASGFGLWRSQTVIKNLQGSIDFQQYEQERMKRFTIQLPAFNTTPQYKKAYVLDDERTWRNIITRWLKEDEFEVETVDNKQAMLALLSKEDATPSHVFLDISLDKVDGSNRDGLSLIEEVQHYAPQARIIIVTGYAKFAENYADMYDVLIEKVNDAGEILDKASFLERVHQEQKASPSISKNR